MAIDKQTQFGGITISSSAIEAVALDAALDCYGVVSLTNQNNKHAKNVNLKERVKAKKTSQGWVVDVYIIIAYGLKLTEIIGEVQKQIKYSLEKTFDITFAAVNVFIEGVKVVE